MKEFSIYLNASSNLPAKRTTSSGQLCCLSASPDSNEPRPRGSSLSNEYLLIFQICRQSPRDTLWISRNENVYKIDCTRRFFFTKKIKSQIYWNKSWTIMPSSKIACLKAFGRSSEIASRRVHSGGRDRMNFRRPALQKQFSSERFSIYARASTEISI